MLTTSTYHLSIRKFLFLIGIILYSPLLLSQTQDSVQYQTFGQQESATAEEYKLSGTVINANTGQGLTGVAIAVEALSKGTFSKSTGRYNLKLPAGKHFIKVSLFGYQKRYFEIELYADGILPIVMVPAEFEVDEVVIEDEAATSQVKREIAGLERMSVLQMERKARLLGETDVLRSLQSVSGVSSVGEGASGFNVRGGNADENLILQDGALIYNPTHALGFYSLFHPDLLSEFQLYKGGVPAKFGGRLSSVLDVKLREGDKEKFNAKGGLGIASSRLSLEGPLSKGKSSFLIGARASYLDWILQSSGNIDLKKSEAFFYDITAKVDAQLTPSTSAGFSVFTSHDDFQFAEEVKLDYETYTGRVYLRQLIGKKNSLNLDASVGRYVSSLFDVQGNTQSVFETKIDYLRFRLNDLISFSENHAFTFGIEGDYSQVSPGSLSPLNNESQIIAKELPIEKGLTLSAYAEEKFAVGNWLNVSLGIRYSQFSNFGPGNVYLYQEGVPKSPFSVIDSLSFGEGEDIATYNALEPRISLKINPGEDKAIKIGYHRSYQFISQISNTASAAPIAIWQLSNYHIEPNFADNYSIGYFQEFLEGKIESSVDIFYRDIHRLIEYKDFANLLLNESVETELLVGKGRSYGVEFYFNKKQGKHQFEGNYTYSRTQRQVEANAEQEGINSGSWYPSNFDKPHILNANYFYQINPRNNISVNFTYSTGRPTTAPVSSYRNSNILNIPVYSDRNVFRIPDYHRLDFAYTTIFRSKRIKRWKSSWTFTVYNLYGRKNAYSVFFQQRPSQPVTAFRIAVLGSVFPAITYNFSF